MEESKLREIIKKAAVDDNGRRKLSCAEAFKIAAEHSVSLRDIGRICNEEQIKIRECQLGCFK
jgi:hypothetical protein